jgi:hypothetical protein
MLGLAESAGENDPAGLNIAAEIPIVKVKDVDWRNVLILKPLSTSERSVRSTGRGQGG